MKRQKETENITQKAAAFFDKLLEEENVLKEKKKELRKKLATFDQLVEEFQERAKKQIRPMTEEEKHELAIELGELPHKSFDHIFKIIAEKTPSFDVAAKEVDVDVDKMGPETLWGIKRYIQSVLPPKATMNLGVKEARVSPQL